jgi:antitoxin (DNA-binding transcriptional repressor) of toxin-antitoxin stability system
MKRVTASEARRDWFRLLDEVAEGEVVVIERRGRRILIKREARGRASAAAAPSYAGLIDAADPERADEWTWDWGDDGELRPGTASST